MYSKGHSEASAQASWGTWKLNSDVRWSQTMKSFVDKEEDLEIHSEPQWQEAKASEIWTVFWEHVKSRAEVVQAFHTLQQRHPEDVSCFLVTRIAIYNNFFLYLYAINPFHLEFPLTQLVSWAQQPYSLCFLHQAFFSLSFLKECLFGGSVHLVVSQLCNINEVWLKGSGKREETGRWKEEKTGG